MRVYLNIPHGIAACGGKRVYGYADGYEPTHIHWEHYVGNREGLLEAPFTPEYISKVMGKEFPLEIRFTLAELKHIDYRALQKIATYFEIESLAPKYNLIFRLHSKLKDM